MNANGSKYIGGEGDTYYKTTDGLVYVKGHGIVALDIASKLEPTKPSYPGRNRHERREAKARAK